MMRKGMGMREKLSMGVSSGRELIGILKVPALRRREPVEVVMMRRCPRTISSEGSLGIRSGIYSSEFDIERYRVDDSIK